MYTHLTQDERYQIAAGIEVGMSLRAIGRQLSRSPSTISREIARNGTERGYKGLLAQRQRQSRASKSQQRIRIQPGNWRVIGDLIRLDWSPEQISNRAAYEGTFKISTERIYQYIYADKAAAGALHQSLRCQKSYRKRYGSGRERRGNHPDRTSIHDRPERIESRTDVGHWEGDTIVGKGRKSAVFTAIKRKTRFTRIGKAASRHRVAVHRTIRRRLSPFKDQVQSLTVDNGREFTRHKGLEKALSMQVYFADPYASWQRGTNENTNGLIRQYLPKDDDFSGVSGAMIRKIETRLNKRPRKCLGYLTPHEAFYGVELQLTVALGG